MGMKNFNGKVVWITGASSGIGEALASQFSKLGAKLILSSRRIEALENVALKCELSEENKLILPIDLSEYKDYQPTVNKVIEKFGKIDILINNGGISQRSRFEETDLHVFKKVVDVNFMGTVALTKAVLPVMKKHKSGHIVAISSVVGKFGTPLRTAYSASKHALQGFFDALRAEVYADGIKVTLVCPGYVKTNISLNAVMGDGSKQGKMDAGQASGISPEDCAKSIIKAIQQNKREIYPAGLKELSGVYMKRFFPGIFSKMVRKINVR